MNGIGGFSAALHNCAGRVTIAIHREVCMNRCLALISAVLIIFSASCGGRDRARSRTVIIFHAGSLALPFEAMEREFEAANPDIDIRREADGSTKCARKIADLGKPCDIMASSDFAVIDKILLPRHASWNVRFASNQLVIAYTGTSRHAATVNANNWYDVLLDRQVVWGYADPNVDPCGYRSLMAMQLAERHYAKPGLYQRLIDSVPKANIRPKSEEQVSLLQTGNMDYAWEYLSVAKQHNLRYVSLPAEINLGDFRHEAFYRNAVVRTAGDKPGSTMEMKGGSITYGVTLVKNAPNRDDAVLFLKYMLSPDGGLKILREMGQPPLVPVRVSDAAMLGALPEGLRPLAAALK